MAKKSKTDDEPTNPGPMVPAVINGYRTAVALNMLVFDPLMFQDEAHARYVEGRLLVFRYQGDRAFIPVVYPWPNGFYAVTSFVAA